MSKSALRLLSLVAAVTFAVTVAGTARAHALGLSRGDYRLSGSDVVVTLTFARAELALAVPSLDQDGVVLSDDVLRKNADAVERSVVGRIDVRGDGAACPGKLESAALDGTDAATLHARFRCDAPPSTIDVTFGLFSVLRAGHRHLGHADLGAGPVDWIASAESPTKRLTVRGGAAPESKTAKAFALFRMGVEHILTGYDHLLFLAGLLLFSFRVKSLVGAITAFTVAHSITLGLATFSIFTPSPRFIEPAIALSIAYVGVENLFIRSDAGRFRVTFPFGLIHGFGFASALRELSLPKSEVPLALLSFNAGVEVGQLAVICVLFPLLVIGRKKGLITTPVARGLSVVVAVVGLVWFVRRVSSG